MKKILLSTLMVLGLGLLTSCDMDKKPFGSIDETTAIRHLEDLGRFRAGVYTSLRGMNGGGWVSYQDLQMDEFLGLVSNGNRGGTFSNGLITSADGDIESMFAGCYSRIATANYLIEKAAELEASGNYEGADLATVQRYKAEGHFLRAFCYFFLADHFSQSYTQIEDPTAAGTGAMIVTKYNPTGDLAAYPSRSSLEATYTLIENDLEEAYEGLQAYEQVDASQVAPNAFYLSSYAVAAMQARVALVKGDYETALAKAKEVIECGTYTLATIEELPAMWTNDEANEIIFRCFSSNSEGLVATGTAYSWGTRQQDADYIPTFATLVAFGDGDARFDAYFKVWPLDIEGSTYPAFVFLKYPGNPALWQTEENNYANMVKPFRLAEMYLVAAEAAIHVSGANPSIYLNELGKNRVVGYTEANYSGDVAMQAVMNERQCELLGEGFRMSDLRRWGLGFERYPNFDNVNPDLNAVVVAAGRDLKYAADETPLKYHIPPPNIKKKQNLDAQQNACY